MNSEAFKLARDTLRKAVKEYGWRNLPIHGSNPPYRTYKYGPGRFEAEHWAIVHYYAQMMDGFSDACGNKWDAYEVTDVERAAFGFKGKYVVLSSSDQGFVSLSEADQDDIDRLLDDECGELCD